MKICVLNGFPALSGRYAVNEIRLLRTATPLITTIQKLF
jgi:hypothetical protein